VIIIKCVLLLLCFVTGLRDKEKRRIASNV
jgi:hypothetical protein